MLTNILTGNTSSAMSVRALVISLVVSLILGVWIALIHNYHNTSGTNFTLTLVILPAIVSSIILLVNGSIGTGVAVMGAFSLIRFRSAPGNSREIASIFLAMAAGLAVGTGYLWIGVIISLVIGLAILIMMSLPHGGAPRLYRSLRITVPETLDYSDAFDDIFSGYLSRADLTEVRTVNMGSLYELSYECVLRPGSDEKAMIDELRVINGNLPIICSHRPLRTAEL